MVEYLVIKRAKDWVLLRIVAPAALWLAQRRLGTQEAWYIVANKPLPWGLRWLGGKDTTGTVHRYWYFADTNRELQMAFTGRRVNVMWRSP